MPGGYPLGLDVCNGTDIGSLAASVGTTIPTTTINVKGAWTQLIASSASDACWVMVMFNIWSSSKTFTYFLDIGVGGAGVEVPIINNLVLTTSSAAIGVYHFPVCIPAGTRISARAQSSTVTDSVKCQVLLFDGGFSQIEGAAGVDSIGAVLATTLGTAVTPSATVNTKGSYAQLTASTLQDYIGLTVAWDFQLVNVAARTDYMIDIAVGGAGSEKIIIPNLCLMEVNAAGQIASPPNSGFFPINIPAGTRLSARAQADVASSAAIGLTAYGVHR